MATLAQLSQRFNIRHTQVTDVRNNPYKNVPQGTGRDPQIIYPKDYNRLGESLGNPVYTNLTFLAGSYTDYRGNIINYPRIDLEGILITLSLPRNVVKTKIQGRNGTVKEYIGEDDAQVSINGIITGTNGRYPSEAVGQLKQVIIAPVAIEVVCPYLQIWDISHLVFDERDLPQEEGSYSYQQFSLTAVSDVPQVLRIAGI